MSDAGPFRAMGTSAAICAESYMHFIRCHCLRRGQIGQARVYGENYKEVATIDYDGHIRRTR